MPAQEQALPGKGSEPTWQPEAACWPGLVPLLRWEASYNLGIPTLDQQHQALFACFNPLLEEINAGAPFRLGFVALLLDDLIAYADYHFEHETYLFVRHGYLGRNEHFGEHNSFLEMLMHLRHQLEHGRSKPELLEPLVRLLASWCLDHLTGQDRDYAEFLLAKGEQ